MNSYRLDYLTDKDFEVVVNELLSQLWGLRIESFKSGRDQGIDGRFYTTEGDQCIVQSKHWERSGYAKLVAHLREDEVPKVMSRC